MPLGEYADFAACVKANQDKRSPEGYCASIEKKITGEWPGVKKAEAFSLDPGTIKKAIDFVSKESHPEWKGLKLKRNPMYGNRMVPDPSAGGKEVMAYSKLAWGPGGHMNNPKYGGISETSRD